MKPPFVYYQNVIPFNVLEDIKKFFLNRTDLYHTYNGNPKVIKINQPWKHLQQLLLPILENYLHADKLIPCGGNIYKHTNHYTTHADDTESVAAINVNIPLCSSNEENTKLIIFDQFTDIGLGRSWDCKTHSGFWDNKKNLKLDLEHNKRSLLRPFDDPQVYLKTDCDIDVKFFNENLNYKDHERWMFKGLSGSAIELRPGSIIIFPSNQLHATGYKNYDWKMGVVLMFKGTMKELLR